MNTSKDNGKFSLLFSSILDSSIWDQDVATRVVWITILAMKNKEGYVRGTFNSLVRNANVTREQCQKALVIFLNPDPDSASKKEEGRRLREVEGGWYVINHEKYQYSSEEKREYWRRQKAEQRKSDELEAKKRRGPKRGNAPDEKWVAERLEEGWEKDQREADMAEAAAKGVSNGEPAPFVCDRPDRHGDGNDASDYDPEPQVKQSDEEAGAEI